MARISEEVTFYNHDKKLEFLEYIGHGYQLQWRNIFNKSKELEIELKKDVYLFNSEELIRLFKDYLVTTSIGAFENRYLVLYNYFQYFLKNREDKRNPFLFMDKKEWKDHCIIKSEKKFLSEEELNELTKKCANPQDACLLQLLFEGLNNDEIIRLKKEDVKWESNTICATNQDNQIRTLTVSDTCMKYIKESIEAKRYKLKNGKSKRGSERYLINNQYVFRAINNGRVKKPDQPVKKQLINDKFTFLLKELSGMPSLCSRDVRYSGMMKYTVDVSKDLCIRINDFKNKDHWSIIAKRFGVPSNISNNYEQYWGVTHNFTLEDVHDLYGEYEEYKTEEFILVEDETKRTLTPRKSRVQAPLFRDIVLSSYQRCAITEETFEEILETCHIQPYINAKSNHIQNGILLRRDIHALLDKGYIAIDEEYRVLISPLLTSPYYEQFHGKKIILPNDKDKYPSKKALRLIMSNFKLESD